MIEYLKKNWKIFVFVGVVTLAIFLRVWHFSDWLFFKMDQARDALLIEQALELGPGWLPLLGPKAGGTHLNLGPAFYYFQYLSSLIFGSAHPAVLAYPDLFFGILAIPLFYFFLKKYFSRDWSMIVTALFAVNFLAVQYSRFAWNPNSLAFFNLLYLLALLNIFDETIKYKLRWVIIAGLSFAISTQLHFLSFATLPVITAVFLFSAGRELKKYLNWKYAAIFAAIVLLVYLPVIVNEIFTSGNNSKEFLLALKEKPSDHTFWQNVKRDFRYWGQNWFLVLTGWISRKASFKPALVAWLAVMLPGLFLAVRSFCGEKNNLKKKFLIISVLWFVAYFLVYIPVAYQIRPRFFLPLLALPFVFIGFIAKYFWEKNKKIWKTAVVAALLVILIGNSYGTYLWFEEIRSAQKRGVYPKRTIILKARDGVVLWHLEKAAEYIKRDCNRPVIFAGTSPEYKTPVKYLLSLNGLESDSIKNFDGKREGCFYAFGLTRSKKFSLENKEKFEVLSQDKFGALTVYKLQPKEGEKFSSSGEGEEKSKRVFWKDIIK